MVPEAKAIVEKFFTNNTSVRFIRLQWVDYSGVLRARFITTARCIDIASGTDHYPIAQICMTIPTSALPRLCTEPEAWELHPDWQTLKICGFAPAHATVMCFNAYLSSLCEVSKDVTFEEFVLLDESFNIAESMDKIVGHYMTAGLRADKLVIMEEIVAALEVSGVEVYHFHTESANQLEIALSPLPPMQAIDALMTSQETIRTISIRHGLRATMAPKLGVAGSKNGCHAHLSMNPAPEASFFLAGILEKLKSLCAFGMPNQDSYCRVAGSGSGLWVGWGTENRDLPIRQISPEHWEFRPVDATANMYLFVAAILSAGLAGMKQNRLLTIRDCPVIPSSLSIEEAIEQLGKYGITEPMPTTLEMSLDSAKGDEELQDWIGTELLAEYLKLKEVELENYSKMTEEARRLRFLSYF